MKKILFLIFCLGLLLPGYAQQIATLESGETNLPVSQMGPGHRYKDGDRGGFPSFIPQEKILSLHHRWQLCCDPNLYRSGEQRTVRERIDVIAKEQKFLRLQEGDKVEVLPYKLIRIGIGTEMFEYTSLDSEGYLQTVMHSSSERRQLLQSALEEGGFIAPLFQERHHTSQPKFGKFTMEEAKLICANMYEALLAEKLARTQR